MLIQRVREPYSLNGPRTDVAALAAPMFLWEAWEVITSESHPWSRLSNGIEAC